MVDAHMRKQMQVFGPRYDGDYRGDTQRFGLGAGKDVLLVVVGDGDKDICLADVLVGEGC